MLRVKGLVFFRVLLVLGVLFGCQHGPESGLQEIHMPIGNQQFTLELALTPSEQETGLMHRDHLDADHGMLFIFSDEKERTFWNHDVSFPLDLVFLDAGQRVVSIKRLETYSEKDVSSDVPAEYAIELNAGMANQTGLKIGTQLAIPADALRASAR
jgi:uncharacterized membrane protein (UPF0127 family)